MRHPGDRLFPYDTSPLDEEKITWAPGRVAEYQVEQGIVPARETVDPTICACRKHPSGVLVDPFPQCMSCRGSGIAGSVEVHNGIVFDGKGNFTGSTTASSDMGDTAQQVRF